MKDFIISIMSCILVDAPQISRDFAEAMHVHSDSTRYWVDAPKKNDSVKESAWDGQGLYLCEEVDDVIATIVRLLFAIDSGANHSELIDMIPEDQKEMIKSVRTKDLLKQLRMRKTTLQIRYCGIKGVLVPVTRYELELRRKLWKMSSKEFYEVKDFYGNVFEFGKDVTVLLPEDMYKCSWKNFEHLKKECYALRLENIAIVATGRDYNHLATMSRQFLGQLFNASDDALTKLASRTINKINSFWETDDSGIFQNLWKKMSYGDNGHNKVTAAYYDSLGRPGVLEEAKKQYLSSVYKACYGRLSIESTMQFVAVDPFAMIDYYFGKRPIEQCGELHSCICANRCNETYVALLRSPSLWTGGTTAFNVFNKYLSADCIYLSIDTEVTRWLQCDFDGDHLYLVWNKTYISLLNDVKRRFNIPTLLYDENKAPKKPILEGDAYDEQVVECIEKCKEFNLVALYSSYATYMWSTIGPNSTEEEVKVALEKLAIIDCAVNHAVDATKRYALDFINDDIAKECSKSVYTNRFRDAFSRKFKNEKGEEVIMDPIKDSAVWDEITAPAGNGSVDRTCKIILNNVDTDIDIEAIRSDFSFKWKMLCDYDYDCSHFGEFSLCKEAEEWFRSFFKYDGAMKKQMRLIDLMMYLSSCNRGFFAKNVDSECNKAPLNELRMTEMKKFVIGLLHQLDEESSEEDLVKYAVNQLTSKLYGEDIKVSTVQFVEDMFGDEMVANIESNRLKIQEGDNKVADWIGSNETVSESCTVNYDDSVCFYDEDAYNGIID